MPQEFPELHVYERDVLEQDNDSLTLLARRIAPGNVVLDLGMGTGGLGRYLAARQAVKLDGVTLSAEEAQRAGTTYRHVHVADLDSADLCQLFAGQRYDRIVCADVLEHLKNPERILQQCLQLLAPEGQLLTSVPNVAYCGLLAELIQGDFRYRPEGLLDSTHLRFFTRQSLQRFFASQGWHIQNNESTTRDVLSSEFQGQFNLLPPAVARHLLALPDASTYQFISTLVPLQPGQSAAPPEAPPSAPALPLFSAQLYLAVDGHFDEAHKQVRPGTMGGGVQTLRFALPPLPEGGYTRVRLDPADRPGFMRLLALSVLASDHSTPLWAWQADTAQQAVLQNAPQQQISWSPPWGPSNQCWLQLQGDDPWLELPLDPDTLQALSRQGGVLEMQATWPMSADYLQANQNLQALQAQLKDVAQLQNTVALGRETQTVLQQNLQQAQLEKSALTQKVGDLNRDMLDTQTQLQNAHAHIARIENSKLFKWTRPLAHAKYTLDGWLGRRAPDNAEPSNPLQIMTAIPDPALAQALPATPVDVIVPVYRGLEDTQRCILSALASPCQIGWHLVVINDCSPEPEVSQWLRDIAAQEPRITLLENEENLGFVATVNRGMRLHPDRDVLLLNSDTEVANDWLDRIQRAAYAQPQVASVTPFSNNATICSYPRFCEANDLPAGWSTQELDQLCAQHLRGQALQVPTGIGFCMYIRRACLDEVGLFDVENFGKGYGEENDFCVRAEQAGWVNLHALDCFVRHAGGVSFGDSKSERELAAMKTIRRLHPQYERDVHDFVRSDPARQARLILDLARITSDKRITILNVIHNRAGGSVRHLDDMARAFAAQAQFLTLTPVDGGLCLRLQGSDEAFRLYWPSLQPEHWQHLVQTLRQLGVSHIHYHHLMGHAPQVATLHELLNVSHDFTAHDYYSYCPQITLTDENDRYCGEKGLNQCHQCLAKRPAPDGLDIVEWRARSLPLLNTARNVFAPSQDTALRMRVFAPQAHVVYAPHINLQSPPLPVRAKADKDRPLKVVVLGALSKIKGADTLETVATLARKQNLPLDFHLLGYGYRSLKTQPRANLTVHGAYQEQDLPDLLKWLDADLAWFPAQCPETYSYTLSACLAAGLPVMASNIGALPERLHARAWSWLVDWQSTPEQWSQHLLQVRNQMLLPLTVHAEQVTLPEQEANDYSTQYLATLSCPNLKALPIDVALSIHQISHHQPLSTSRYPRLLKLVYWFREHPWLSSITKLIPTHFQRRIKSTLLGQ
jgi:GT2 family glycosyltransferase/2-polyprenyl-3-methyl-5-hydroxy-6-metoxy-1,4-benzoquinol methylase/glycosyltransferase involved in cell wall biosynthesis